MMRYDNRFRTEVMFPRNVIKFVDNESFSTLNTVYTHIIGHLVDSGLSRFYLYTIELGILITNRDFWEYVVQTLTSTAKIREHLRRG